ncbi:MAG: YggS family pyridoxal phosphate-dependent enzyme [Candidatus Dadabacteria bacterium]|nr:YggS family pyridoxal phosphate-dependent enzyme [Candidatus Dadabacteria bacterium]NIQ16305.1 YggS family pyridoxal phosphate-dependent enzyme [Candidatus Dadabacteria bacterium]
MDLKARIETVFERIEKACDKSSRNLNDIKLVAVSKKFSVQRILDAYNFGLRDFGENYAQEFRDKYNFIESEIKNSIKWHFIGKLQKNKVKYVVGKVSLIHTIDNLPLAMEIDKKAKLLGVSVDALIEVNIGGEAVKSGIEHNKADGLLNGISELENINIKGFMAMTPYFEVAEKTRPYFSKLRKLRDDIQNYNQDVVELSMGMSNDFEVAIEEGATIIRVGSAIFGPRN